MIHRVAIHRGIIKAGKGRQTEIVIQSKTTGRFMDRYGDSGEWLKTGKDGLAGLIDRDQSGRLRSFHSHISQNTTAITTQIPPMMISGVCFQVKSTAMKLNVAETV